MSGVTFLNKVSRAAESGEPSPVIDANEFADLYASFRRMGDSTAQQAVAALKDPSAPHFNYALARVLEDHPMTTAAWAFEEYGRELAASVGLEAQTIVAELDQFFGDETVRLTGRAIPFDNVDAATRHAKTLANQPGSDAVVLQSGTTYFVHTIEELAGLDGPNSPEDIRGHLEASAPPGYQVVLFSDGRQTYSAFNDAEVLDIKWFGGALDALQGGAPIVAVGAHGTFNFSGGPNEDGDYATAVGGHFFPTWGSDIADASDHVRAVLFIAAGCNTGEYKGHQSDLGASFLEADSARTFIGSRGFMQNGAEMGGIRRILTAMRENPDRPLSEIVEAENLLQERNRLQDASFVIVGDKKLTYAQILGLASGTRQL
ncbi:MAG: hypothetical protein AAF658_07415 [Myxococcota bacterium]